MDDRHCHGNLGLSAGKDFTSLVVTRTNILTSHRSTGPRGSGFSAMRTLSYRACYAEAQHAPMPSVLYLAPLHFRRKISWLVSYYALFKGWLLLSQPPRCRRNSKIGRAH